MFTAYLGIVLLASYSLLRGLLQNAPTTRPTQTPTQAPTQSPTSDMWAPLVKSAKRVRKSCPYQSGPLFGPLGVTLGKRLISGPCVRHTPSDTRRAQYTKTRSCS